MNVIVLKQQSTLLYSSTENNGEINHGIATIPIDLIHHG
jgi:hypothetical protein